MKMTVGQMSKRDTSRLEQAKRIASTSDCRYKHGTIITRGGRVVAVGVNSYRHTVDVFDSVPDDARSVHAEEAALRALGGEATGATLYVARVNNLGEERMSKPCNRCMEQIRSAGIKRVVYTIETEIELD